MTSLTRIKLALAIAGIAMWAYGARVGDGRLQWGGIVLVAVALALRFVRPKPGATEREGRRGP